MWVLLLLAAPACGEEVPVYGADPFARDPVPIGSLAGKFLTSNVGDDSLSVLDPAQPTLARRLPVGFNPVELEGPHHLSADPAGRFVYLNLSLAVSGSGSGPHGVHGLGDQPGYVLKLDVATGREVGRARVDANPGDNTLSHDGKTLYVTHYDEIRWKRDGADANLALVDVETMFVRRRRPLCPAAHGVRLAADGATLYSTCGSDELAVVDLADPELAVRRVAVPDGLPGRTTCQRCPYALAVAPDGTVWVSSLGPNNGSGGRGSVDVYDPRTGSFDPARRMLLAGRPVFTAFAGTAAAFTAFVPEQVGPGDRVHVVAHDGPEAPVRPLPALELSPGDCLNAHMLLVAPDGSSGQLVCEGNHRGPGSFLWLDLANRTVLHATPIGVFPDGVLQVPSPPLVTP